MKLGNRLLRSKWVLEGMQYILEKALHASRLTVVVRILDMFKEEFRSLISPSSICFNHGLKCIVNYLQPRQYC